MCKTGMETAPKAADTGNPAKETRALEGATTGLILQMVRVLNLYKEIYGIISAEDKSTESYMQQYSEVFAVTEARRISDIHTDLITGVFKDRPHAYIGMPHLLKKRIASLGLEEIELGSNLLDESGKPKRKGVYLPLGPIWRMSVKLRGRAKNILKAGSEKIEKTDVMHTGMHQLFQLVIQHLEPLMEDKKALARCEHAIAWYHDYRILYKEEEGTTFRDAITKARSLITGPLLGQIISGAGLGKDIGEEDIQDVVSKLFGNEDEDSNEMESIFSQISSGDLDPSKIGSIITAVTGTMREEDESGEEDVNNIDEYDEHVRYEDID